MRIGGFDGIVLDSSFPVNVRSVRYLCQKVYVMVRLIAGVVLSLAVAVPSARAADAELAPKQLAEIWDRLGQHESAVDDIGRLVRSPGGVVPFLKKHLQPVPAPDRKQIGQYLADLDSKNFRQRENAAKELEVLGQLAGPAVEAKLKEKLPLEVRRRLEMLQARLNHGRAIRAAIAAPAHHRGAARHRHRGRHCRAGTPGRRGRRICPNVRSPASLGRSQAIAATRLEMKGWPLPAIIRQTSRRARKWIECPERSCLSSALVVSILPGDQPELAARLQERLDITHIKVEDGKGKPLGRSFQVKLWPNLVFLKDGQVIRQLARPDPLEVRRTFQELFPR